jgi:Tol biopolymer transport system component
MRTFLIAAVGAALTAALAVLPAPARPEEAPKIKVVNLGCNTAADEDEPHLASGGSTLYYASNSGKKFDLMVSKRNSVGKWSKGEPLGGYVATPADDKSCFVTPDGTYPQFLYYASKTDEMGDNFDLYVAVRQAAGRDFSAPTAINVADTAADEMHPWLTKDGKSLYFTRKTKKGLRVFTGTRKDAKGAQGFEEPALVEELPADFHHATLTPDGKTMYLQGPLEKGRWGLFVSTKGDKVWGAPEALEQLNDPSGPTGDRSPCLARDGQTLYFASDRDGGKGGLDLWSVAVSELKKK